MNDLFEPQVKRSIEKSFVGKRVTIDQILDKPIEVHDFEIGKGRKSGHKVLYMQLKFRGEWRFFWTEAFKLINRIERSNRAKLPFLTKIGWDDENKYLIFKKVK